MDGILYRSLHAAVRALARALFHLEVVGGEHVPTTGGAVIVANHESWLDPILVALALPRKPAFLAMEELWRMPGIALVMHAYGPLAIPINRSGVDTTALRRALRALEGGALLIIFPEGGIPSVGETRPFHPGAAMLAARTRVPMIPIGLRGTADALPLGRILPRRRPITVRIGAPIAPPGVEREDVARASDEAALRIRALLGARSS